MRLSELSETARLAFSALNGSKMRSFLASLGVVIGISLVILMGWMLNGLDKALVDTINTLGVDMLYIDKWLWAGDHHTKDIESRKNITLDEYEQFKRKAKTPELIYPMARNWMATFKYANKYYEGLSVIGTAYEHSLTPSGETEIGRYFSPYEEQSGADVIVIGNKVFTTIFPNGDALGKYLKISGRKFEIIGVLKKQGSTLGDGFDNQSYIPINSFNNLYDISEQSLTIAIKAGGEKNLDEVRAEALGLMRQIRNIYPGKEEDFSINETKAFDNIIGSIRKVLWGVGIGMTALSFFVGIIGIMNIMFVSVTERTKEIGIRKSIGAKRRSIWIQFLVESSVLSLLGAFTAFVICSILVWLVATFLPDKVPEIRFLQPYLPFELLFIATIVSVFVGILAGLIPAIRAARLDPVEALRFD